MHGTHSAFVILLSVAAAAGAAEPVREAARAVSGAESGPQLQAPPIPTARTVASLAEIAGEWDIVSFDGHASPRLDSEGKRYFYVDVGPQALRFAIGCNHSGMPGRIEGGVLHAGPNDDGVQTAMGCGPEREARDAAFFTFFRSRPQVALLPDGRLRMATPGHELLLERSSVRRLAMGPALSEITGSWRVVSFMRFEGGGYHGWGAMYAPGRLRIGDGRLSYSRCPAASVRFTFTSDFVLRRQDGREPSAAVECPGVTPAPTEVETMLGALLGQSPEAERINDKRFILRSRDYAVLLTGEADYQREFGHSVAEWERNPG